MVASDILGSSPRTERAPLRILHLTDFAMNSFDEQHTHARAIWTRLHGFLDDASRSVDRNVDFVVVSGDIAIAAEPSEYAAALTFLAKYIDPVVKGARDRVIIVPGNHDVSWRAPVGPPIPQTVRRQAEHDFRTWWERSTYRFDVAETGEFGTGYKIDPAMYSHRFRNFQSFIEKYYGDWHSAPHRQFQLTHDRNWSAHVFADMGISFYGINSCTRSDRYARGAGFEPSVLHQLSAYLRSHPTPLNVGVWHHGPIGRPGQRDFVDLEILDMMEKNGLTFGMHGHVHTELWDGFRDRFPVIGTRPFRHYEQPTSCAQFTLINVSPSSLHVQPYQLDRSSLTPRELPSKRYRLGPLATELDLESVRSAEGAPEQKSAMPQQALSVFLCHASEDKEHVKRIAALIRSWGHAPWLDEEQILPGEDWDAVIRTAIEAAQIVIVCLSPRSGRRGYVQKELKRALDIADEFPAGEIYVVPVRIEPCSVPARLKNLQWVNLWEAGAEERLRTVLAKQQSKVAR